MKKHRFKNSERGQSFLELAISITFLFIMLAGAIDLGRVFFTYISLRDAVQEGASYAAMTPANCQEIIKRVKEQSDQPINLETDTAISIVAVVNGVTCTSTTPLSTTHFCPGDPISVSVTYTDFKMMMPFMGGQTFPLRAEIDASVLMDSDPPDPGSVIPAFCTGP